jgi:hypothetical protein
MQIVAKKIQEFNKNSDLNFTLTVGGHFIPDSLKDEIKSYDAITMSEIKNDNLNNILKRMDILITGYPQKDETSITKYQISSKIADSLSINKPVLVPYSTSVKDLSEIDGIYIFDEENFYQKLKEAIKNQKEIKLNKIFTLSYNYQQFLKLEKISQKQSKEDIFRFPLISSIKGTKKSPTPTLVLFWKQLDSSIYGRRVDQIARSYKKANQSHRVIILETLNTKQIEEYETNRDFFISDDAMVLERYRAKKNNLVIDGIEHRVVISDNNYKENLKEFLLINNILPTNSIMILFPILNRFETLLNTIDGYKTIVDVVDNQLGWSTKYPEHIIKQYISLTKLNHTVVFNSKNNQEFFYKHNLLNPNQKNMIIENWYEVPSSYTNNHLDKNSKETKLLYSGNMNDRIDWNLLENLLKNLPKNTTLYLIGNAQRAFEKVKYLADRYKNCIYLGPLDERSLIGFVDSCHLAIMPHTIESTSLYMNPLKLHMYHAIGIECVSSDIPGLEKKFENLSIASTNEDFVSLCLEKVTYKKKKINTDISKSKSKYLKLLNSFI